MNEILISFLGISSVCSILALQYDIAVNNRELPKQMRILWLAVIIFSGVIGLAIYWQTSRNYQSNPNNS